MTQIIGASALINVAQTQIGEDSINTVNARDLHKFLGVKTQFSIWLTKRIDKFNFTEGEDFIKVELPAGSAMSSNIVELGDLHKPNQKILAVESMGYESFGQQGRIEYAISIDMAKELSMIENNDKGKEARKYFIQCEKTAKAITQAPALIPTNYIEALEFLVASEKTKAVMAAELQVAAPKIEFYDAVSSEGSLNELNYTLKEAANLLGTGRTRFSVWLQDNGYMTEKRQPYQSVLTAGHMSVKIKVHKEFVGYGEYVEHKQYTPYVTGKGLTYFAKKVPESLKGE